MSSWNGAATRTDILVQPGETRIEQREPTDTLPGFQIRRTTQRPDYQDGNQLLLEHPPRPGDLARWIRTYLEVFPNTAVGHVVLSFETDLAWSWPEGAAPCLDEEYEKDLVLTARSLGGGPEQVPGYELRRLDAPDDWPQLLLQSAHVLEARPGSELEDFLRWRNAAYQESTSAAGASAFWGAFHGAELVASLGLFVTDEWARYQNVLSVKEHRRRGLATALISCAAKQALLANPRTTLVIVAEEGGPAEPLYRNLGFRAVGRQHTIRLKREEPDAS